MSASVSDIQRRLDGLNTSDENYRGLLSELLSHKDLKAYIHSLQKPGLRGFIELLDQVSRAARYPYPRVLTSYVVVRRSTTSRSLTTSSERLYVDCRVHAPTVRSFRGLISSKAKSFRIEGCQSLPEISLTRTKGSSMEKRFASRL